VVRTVLNRSLEPAVGKRNVTAKQEGKGTFRCVPAGKAGDRMGVGRAAIMPCWGTLIWGGAGKRNFKRKTNQSSRPPREASTHGGRGVWTVGKIALPPGFGWGGRGEKKGSGGERKRTVGRGFWRFEF